MRLDAVSKEAGTGVTAIGRGNDVEEAKEMEKRMVQSCTRTHSSFFLGLREKSGPYCAT